MYENRSMPTFFVCTILTPYHTYDITSITDGHVARQSR